jgi:DNA-binding transcriptional MocR family regulator
MRRVYRRRRDALLHALQARFGSRATVTDTSSGLHLVVRFDTGRVAEQARRHGVVLLGTAACYADASSAPAHEFLLRFSNASERAITEAVRRMASADR